MGMGENHGKITMVITMVSFWMCSSCPSNTGPIGSMANLPLTIKRWDEQKILGFEPNNRRDKQKHNEYSFINKAFAGLGGRFTHRQRPT